MAPDPPAPANRRGFNVLGVVILILFLSVSGLALMQLARESGRSSHWLLLGQIAFNTADTAMRECLLLLQEENSFRRARAAEVSQSALESLLAAMATPAPGTVTLMDGSDPSTLTTAVRDLLAGHAEYQPRLTVTVDVVDDPREMVPASLGLPKVAGERQGVIRLQSVASIRSAPGQTVGRTIVVEKAYKMVSIVPPILGRFVLFVGRGTRGGADPNIVRSEMDLSSFDAVLSAGSPEPLVVRAGAGFGIMTSRRDPADPDRVEWVRDQTSLTTAPPDLLDRQGWVYLGSDSGGWHLDVAHGFSGYGESFLLPGSLNRVQFRGSAGEDSAYRSRFVSEWRNRMVAGPPPGCTVSFPGAAHGLHRFRHGMVLGQEILGVPGGGAVEDPDTGVPYYEDLGSGKTSVLRLFGTPDRASPTLVLGPVYAHVNQRASIRCQEDASCSPVGRSSEGLFHVLPRGDYPAGDPMGAVLASAFDGSEEREGTARIPVRYTDLVPNVLYPHLAGVYGVKAGIMEGPPHSRYGTPHIVHSELLSDLAPTSVFDGFLRPFIDDLAAGRLNAPRVFTKELALGFDSFFKALESKLAYVVWLEPPAGPGFLPPQFLDPSGRLSLPGIVQLLVDEDPPVPDRPLILPGISGVSRGGILYWPGPIRIQGSIIGGVEDEPLTLIAKGDITIADGVDRIEGYLVSKYGSIVFENQSAALTIRGGMACDTFDVVSLEGRPAPRTLEYDPTFDPARLDPADPQDEDNLKLLRVFYGDATVPGPGSGPLDPDPRVAVMGSGP